MRFTPTARNRPGFTLVELLVVIMVIGLITAIAVPIFGRFDIVANKAKDQKNAKSAAAICSSAKVAGYDFVANAADPTSQHWVLHAITDGATISDPGNPFDGSYFAVPNLSEDQIYGAQKYLSVINGELVYNAAGDSVDPVEPAP